MTWILLGILITFFSIITLIIIYGYQNEQKEIKEGKEILLEIMKEAKSEFNFTIDKDDFEIKIIGYKGGYVFTSPPPIYGLRKKGVTYKSKYFKELEKKYYRIGGESAMLDINNFFSDKGGAFFISLIGDFGLQPYILNTLIYDKSKGNDFKKIEEIFNRYGEDMYYKAVENVWKCGEKEKYVGNEHSLNYVKNINCLNIDKEGYVRNYNEEEVEKYSKKYEEYFSKPRNFNSIDWEEYMKIHEIYPIIQFYTKGTKEEIERLQKEIETYYNKELLEIMIN